VLSLDASGALCWGLSPPPYLLVPSLSATLSYTAVIVLSRLLSPRRCLSCPLHTPSLPPFLSLPLISRFRGVPTSSLPVPVSRLQPLYSLSPPLPPVARLTPGTPRVHLATPLSPRLLLRYPPVPRVTSLPGDSWPRPCSPSGILTWYP